MLKKIIYCFIFILISSCAQVTSLNLKKHHFGRLPTKIVWIQVAGLAPEHLAMLKFSYPSRSQLTAFENSLCVGTAWEYNLFKIRPSVNQSFMSQVTGKKNIRGECVDYTHKPIWKYIQPHGYKIGLFEGGMGRRDSLLNAKKCDEGKDYLKNVVMWSREKAPSKESKLFHVNRRKEFKPGEVYYDQSCLKGQCFSNLESSVEVAFESFQKNKKNYLFIVRNQNYLKYLKKGNIAKAKDELLQLNNMLNYFQGRIDKNMLVLLTSSRAYDIDFPRRGNEWKEFESKNKFLRSRNSKLLGSVYASGARAENFCGMYDQSQIMQRIFSDARKQGLEFSIINPFK